MTRRVDFSGNAAVYDARHGAAAEENGLRRVCEAAGLNAGSTVLDIGAGTGRVSIPLCDLGYRVIAVEPAAGMVEKLRVKAGQRHIEALQAEGSHLPVVSQSIDAVLMARLLYLTPDWRLILSEALRVLKPHGALVHEWGNGASDEPWVLVREKARALFESEGVASPFHPGARFESEVDACLASIGLLPEVRLIVGRGSKTSLLEFFVGSLTVSFPMSGMFQSRSGRSLYPACSNGQKTRWIWTPRFMCPDTSNGSSTNAASPSKSLQRSINNE